VHACARSARGVSQAAFNLGFMHEYGIACSANTTLARDWYGKAMASGSAEAYWAAWLALAKLEVLEGLGLHGLPVDELAASALTVVGATAFVAAAFIGVTLMLRIRGRQDPSSPALPRAIARGNEEGESTAAAATDNSSDQRQ
jgi:TPR repeat protein